MLITTIAIIPLKGEPIVITIEKGIKYTDARATAKDNINSTVKVYRKKIKTTNKNYENKF